MFDTDITRRFGAEHPLLNAGMGMAAGGDLAGAVASAGGIGVLGSTGMDGDELEAEIEKARDRSDGPIVVDIVFPAHAPEQDTDAPEPEYIPAPIQQLTEELEEDGAEVPDTGEVEAHTFSKQDARELMDVTLAKDVDGLATAVGAPDWAIEEAHDVGMQVISLAGKPKHAYDADEAGADIIVADGTEGGGHSGPVSTLDLIPKVRGVTDKPVVAAGGISTGAQILACLSCGADGVWMGTRFIPTEESDAEDEHKDAILGANEAGSTVRSRLVDGLPIRMIRNRFTEVWEGKEDEIQDFPEQMVLTTPLMHAAGEADARDDYGMHPAGQGSMLIEDTDEYPSAEDVVAELIEQTEMASDRLLTLRR
jgi:NAD(P)H-dependent flavin oxidoreductase YrpB (nitropropane dioxygenase family)